jgi:hypothetical protein
MSTPVKPLAVILLASSALLQGCKGSADRPTDEALKAAIAVSLKEKGMNEFVMGCGVMKGDLKALDTVEVVAWGEKNEPAGYIPVKVHVSGTCEAQNPRCGADNNQLCPPEDESFNTRKEGLSSDQERPIVFHLKKGDFDAWTA